MPHFSKCCGLDEYICQCCGAIKCSNCFKPEWRPDITGHKNAGNACPTCVERFSDKTRKNVAQQQSDSHIKWIDARFSTQCPNNCGVTIQQGDKIGKPQGAAKFVCERCAVIVQSTRGLDARAIGVTKTDDDNLRRARHSRINSTLNARRLEPLNPLDYADDTAELDVQRELRRLRVSNAPQPSNCNECGAALESHPGMVGEQVLVCAVHGIKWEDSEDAVRRVY